MRRVSEASSAAPAPAPLSRVVKSAAIRAGVVSAKHAEQEAQKHNRKKKTLNIKSFKDARTCHSTNFHGIVGYRCGPDPARLVGLAFLKYGGASWQLTWRNMTYVQHILVYMMLNGRNPAYFDCSCTLLPM